MIKNYEDFVNEGFKGFLDSVIYGIEHGVSGYKTARHADSSVEKEAKMILASGKDDVSKETQMSVLVKKLITRSAIIADYFTSRDRRTKKISSFISEIELTEDILGRMKELVKSDDEYENNYDDFDEES